jgi:hypothetical protein
VTYARTGQPTVSCDVYADQAQRVLSNDTDALAYDFNVTDLGGGRQVAVFHSQPYGKQGGCASDSVAVDYANSVDGPFGVRTHDADDFVITRTNDSYPADFMSSVGSTIPACYYTDSGGGNPILLQNDTEWDMFYMSVSDYNYLQETNGNPGHNGNRRLFLGMGKPWNVNDMVNSTWWGLVNGQHGGGPTADSWQPFTPALKYVNANLWPVRSVAAGDSLDNKVLASQYPNAPVPGVEDIGLIGNMSFGGAAGETNEIYYFHMDFEAGNPYRAVTLRRQPLKINNFNWVNWWNRPQQVLNAPAGVAYHAGLNQWAVLYGCFINSSLDVCLRFSGAPQVSSVNDANTPVTADALASLGLADPLPGASGTNVGYFQDPSKNGIMEQIGMTKNGKGQIPSNDFRLYVTQRVWGPGALALDPYGMDMYSVRINCH